MNELFLKRMQALLNDEYDDYLQAFQSTKINRGFRINNLKITTEDFFNMNDIPCHKSPFAKDGYILDNDQTYGNTLPYALGLMIMQEPSASSVVGLLDIKQGEWVLDLCAAPGSKATQIGQYLNNTGRLFANEIDNQRSQILLSNLERLGIYNATITNSSSETLCPKLIGLMDKVLVDAPCSGEGMFRKEDKAIDNWSLNNVLACAKRQQIILDNAYLTLKENGILVYSTCTLNKEENELVIEAFLDNHPDMELVNIDVEWGRKGFPTSKPTQYCRRIFLMDEGEGHFMAKMVKKGSSQKVHVDYLKEQKLDNFVQSFISDQISLTFPHHQIINNRVYLSNEPFIDLHNTKVLRSGVYAGEIIKNRFEPTQHFYKCFDITNYSHKVKLSYEQAVDFVKGNVLNFITEKGYVALYYDKYVLGYGKSDGKQIKNHYPKGLRVR